VHVIRFTDIAVRRWPHNEVFRGFSHEFARFPLVLLGPNGAGKSTLFSVISGARRPQAGRVAVGGWTTTGRLRRHIGLVSQKSQGLRGLAVRELVAYAGWLKGLSRSEAWARSAGTLERLHLREIAAASSVAISGGEARRMMIAMALVSDPALLLFDEPTTGLDPAERSNVLAMIAEISMTRPTIVATHEVDDIEERFRHLAVLDGGELAFDGTVPGFLALGEGTGSPRARAEQAYRTVLTRHRSGSPE
jgi:ABC-type multidrug transport system ATPase subunit